MGENTGAEGREDKESFHNNNRANIINAEPFKSN